jgi:hypothetical protein
LALRIAMALVTGSVAHPTTSKPAEAADPLMKARLVSFMQRSPLPLSELKARAQGCVHSTRDVLAARFMLESP